MELLKKEIALIKSEEFVTKDLYLKESTRTDVDIKLMFYDEELPYITTYDVAGTVAKHGWGIGGNRISGNLYPESLSGGRY